ncbi:prostaglandin E2 receptor EP3 subtype-like [Haliotis rufescens]|uniref:prostaglandin E2 receptor EP3 subtype-like n=1 Tax=Haliotis rufescens TaxID=6454 RepID=UPI001EAFE034|nr:prostaglandin E2 receptor EP3 subtype-like [Haliotis rufescens]
MAADRCAALRKPYWYQENMFSWRFWAPFVCVVCIITLICLFPQMGLGKIVIYETSGNVSVRRCGPLQEGMSKNIKESTFPVLYGSVGLVMVATNLSFNVAVLKTLHAMKKRVHPSARYRQDTSQEFEMTKMLLALSATFLICWLPLNLQLVLVQQGVHKYRVVDIIVHSLVSLNFVVDPVINLTVKRKYRDKMRRIFICKRRSETETNGPFRLTTLSTNTEDIMTARPE